MDYFVGVNADLLLPPARVINGQNPSRMSFTPGTGLATLLMPDLPAAIKQ
jgi:hypothetical protein